MSIVCFIRCLCLFCSQSSSSFSLLYLSFLLRIILVYMAVELEQPDIVELLLSHALSKSQTEEEMEEMERRDAVMHNMLRRLFRGKFTCLMKAKEEGFEVIVELLRKYGAKTSFCYASDLSI